MSKEIRFGAAHTLLDVLAALHALPSVLAALRALPSVLAALRALPAVLAGRRWNLPKPPEGYGFQQGFAPPGDGRFTKFLMAGPRSPRLRARPFGNPRLSVSFGKSARIIVPFRKFWQPRIPFRRFWQPSAPFRKFWQPRVPFRRFWHGGGPCPVSATAYLAPCCNGVPGAAPRPPFRHDRPILAQLAAQRGPLGFARAQPRGHRAGPAAPP